MNFLTTFDEVTLALGGVTAVGRLTDNPAAAVCNWRRKRGRFPTRYWLVISTELERRGFFADYSLFGFYMPFQMPLPDQRRAA